MARILLDLTDIEQWNGIHGGTQRVVYGIARHFYQKSVELPDDIVFMSFDAEEKRFFVSDFAPILHRVERRDIAAPQQDVLPAPTATLKQRLKPFVPKSVRTNPKVRYIAANAYHRVIRERPTPAEEAPKRNWIDFESRDIVLMLGKPWDNLDIQKTLTSERKAHGFTVAQVVYDLIICLYPHLHHPSLVAPYTAHMKDAIANSDLLLPISESTARDVEHFSSLHSITPPQMKVIRLGDKIDLPTGELKQPDERIDDSFILCVATIEIRKNHTLLYYAYKLAEEKGIKLPQLLLVGGHGWLSGDVQHLINTDPAMKNKIVLLHGIDDAGLAWLFRHSLFTVYPSMYEGWGLPVAESLGYGKACVASKASSIPEIGGDLLDYFSPYDTAECLEKLQLYCDEQNRRQKEKRINKEYRQTTWEQTFDQVYKAIVNENHG